MQTRRRSLPGILILLLLTSVLRGGTKEITFNLNFEGASLGRIDRLSDTHFVCHVRGQQDERGRNRQATWYFFRMDHVAGKEITLTLTDFVGEYHNTPGANPMSADIVPVLSEDGKSWKHFPSTMWDAEKKEPTLQFTPTADSIWIAHIPPYTPADLHRLLDDLRDRPNVLIETIGKTVQQRDMPMITVTNVEIPDAGKKLVWLQARQHAWEAGTSFVMEGSLRFITSDDPSAKTLRDKIIFKFTPMVDIDGCTNGQVRSNANGFDVNQHWKEVDLRNPEMLKAMPEIWYTKKAILACHANHPIDLMVNMHDTETGEFLDTEATDAGTLKMMHRFDALLEEKTTFDPSMPLGVRQLAPDDTNSLWSQAKIPVMLMEQRISTSKKLGRHATTEDRVAFGKKLIQEMAEAVLPN